MNIVIKKKRAFKGLYLPENKITAKKPIEMLPVPDKVVIPLQQNIGAPCEFIVETMFRHQFMLLSPAK